MYYITGRSCKMSILWSDYKLNTLHMFNIFRFSQVRALQGEGFKLVDALRLAYKDYYYIQYRKSDNILTDILKGFILFAPFSLVFFV